jgi:hypothetical protein
MKAIGKSTIILLAILSLVVFQFTACVDDEANNPADARTKFLANGRLTNHVYGSIMRR